MSTSTTTTARTYELLPPSSLTTHFPYRYDDDTLDSLGLDEVDDATVGFAEMMSIKLGELMDQPRHVRVQALQTELAKKEEAEKARDSPITPTRQKHEPCHVAPQISHPASPISHHRRGSPSRSRRRRIWRWRRR